MLELIMAIPEYIGWMICGCVGTLCVMLSAGLVECFIRGNKEGDDD